MRFMICSRTTFAYSMTTGLGMWAWASQPLSLVTTSQLAVGQPVVMGSKPAGRSFESGDQGPPLFSAVIERPPTLPAVSAPPKTGAQCPLLMWTPLHDSHEACPPPRQVPWFRHNMEKNALHSIRQVCLFLNLHWLPFTGTRPIG
ncbi:hypothetical protein F5Y02DRAFT_270912 [Annulohypoxylon stygium]|nr:hypothetical protein F5Y02DRAFT_270912 [Annulohypoxylon stygium]